MNVTEFQKKPFSFKFRILFLVAFFIFLIIIRLIIGAFGVSLGYLYVTLISLAGFWFGFRGGISAALTATVIFFCETSLFVNWEARDIVVNAFFLRVFVYFLAGTVMGYLSNTSEKQKKEILELSEMKNRFVGIAAHDLRNPISVIRDCSVLLSEGEEKFTSEKKRKFIDMIKRSSTFMLELINDILDISRIESGKVFFELETYDYMEIVNEAIDFNRFLAAKKDVEIEVKQESPLPVVRVDRERIVQLLNNILGNAVKYTYRETTITVEIKIEGEYVVTNIVDRGPGLSEDDIDHIFSEFYKGKSKPPGPEEHASTGLGLAIAKKIVEGHGGRIGVKSKAGEGAAFYFLIPIKDTRNEGE